MKAISELTIHRAIGALTNRVNSCDRMLKTKRRGDGTMLNDQHLQIIREGRAKDAEALAELNGSVGSNVVRLEVPE